MSLNGILLLDVPSGTRLIDHIHDAPHLCAIASGSVVESDGHGSRVLQRLNLRLSPPTRRDLRFGDQGARCLVADVGPQIAVRLKRPVHGVAPLWALNAMTDLAVADASISRMYEAEILSADIASWLTAEEVQAGSPPRWLLRVREAVRETHGLIHVHALAEEAGVHRVYLSRKFRACFGLTLSAYVQRIRGSRALFLLRETELSLADIALEAGYFDQAHFCRWSKRNYGIAPASLRARLQLSNTAWLPPLQSSTV